MIKDFEKWNKKKISIDRIESSLFFYEIGVISKNNYLDIQKAVIDLCKL